MTEAEGKKHVSRRRFVKYAIASVAAVIAAVVGYGAFTRKREEPTQTATRTVPQGSADMILMNGKVLTVDPNDRIVEAVALKSGVIQAAGSYNDLKQLVGPATKQVDLKGKTVTPGIIDGHLHMHYLGKQYDPRMMDIRFPTVKTREDLIRKIQERLKTTAKGEWIASNQGFLFPDPPNRWELDKIAPDNPVYLLHNSGQFAVVNSQALKVAGINKNTPDPYGGVIAKDSSTGEPNGFLYHYPAIDLVRIKIPFVAVGLHGDLPGQEEEASALGDGGEETKREWVLIGEKKCFEAGITSVQDVIISVPPDVKVYMDLAKEGKMRIDVCMLLYVKSLEDAKAKLSKADHWKGKNYTFAGFKLAVDGGIAAGTVLMYDANTPASQKSYLYHTQETLNEIVAMFHKEGYQLGFHVIGDKAIDMALDAIEYAMKTSPRSDPRHRLEHAVVPTAQALDRIKQLGVIVSTQPGWLSMFGPGYEKGLGGEHMKRFMPLKSMLDKGIHLAFGCDAPAVPLIEPKWGLIAATTRWTLDKRAIHPEQSISMKDALRAYTMEPAYAAFEENVRGSIEPGKMADVVVWSHDLYTTSPEQLLNLKPEATIVEGQVVYKAADTTIVF